MIRPGRSTTFLVATGTVVGLPAGNGRQLLETGLVVTMDVRGI